MLPPVQIRPGQGIGSRDRVTGVVPMVKQGLSCLVLASTDDSQPEGAGVQRGCSMT